MKTTGSCYYSSIRMIGLKKEPVIASAGEDAEQATQLGILQETRRGLRASPRTESLLCACFISLCPLPRKGFVQRSRAPPLMLQTRSGVSWVTDAVLGAWDSNVLKTPTGADKGRFR